jgi:KaiC/GvpD/RAD55 family RecA-like ATPase
MVLASTLPKEISEALESLTFSLHIKGSAGTGKTTMALELVRYMNCPAIYLSTRVSPSRLYNQFPWSETCLHKENILDANTSLDLQTTREETLFEYVDRPSFLKNLYSRVLENKGEHLAIIVDSVDYLKWNLRIPQEDLSVERDILDIAERVNANAIFISEVCEESRLDHLVDGVVRLEREIVNGRLLRKLYVEKVRRIKIDNPIYLFTLKNGRFKVFETGFSVNLTQTEPPRLEQGKGTKIPTLIPELDKILEGGFERGTFNIFDVGNKVGINHLFIAIPIFLNSVLRGIPVFSIPSKGVIFPGVLKSGPLTSLGEVFLSSLSSETFNYVNQYFTLVLPLAQKIEEHTISFNVHFLNGEDYIKDLNNFLNYAVEVLNRVKANTLVVSIATDIIEYLYGSENTAKVIQTWLDKIKQLNGIMTIFQFGHETHKIPTHLANSYFKIENVAGNIVFYGELPKTKMYVAGLDVSKGYVQTSLTPIE